MRSYLSLSVFALSLAAAAVACSGGGGDPGSSSGEPTSSSSSSGTPNASSGSGSSGQSSSSSSGEPVEPRKPGAPCEAALDCDDGVCIDSTCRAPRADDGVKNGNESGIDCGSSGPGADTGAPACTTGGACAGPSDCVSLRCEASLCLAPTSSDGIKNGNETGIDCGASAVGQETNAPKCADTFGCGIAADCLSGVCNVTCQVPTSSDGIKNGNETDVDCGSLPLEEGMTDTGAEPCNDLRACLDDPDCTSLVCASEICQAPTCVDAKKNGTETDLNCGGLACAPCADSKACLVASDCQSGVCTGNVCQQPTSGDGVKNGNETDVDCGEGPAGFDTNAPVCRNARACLANGDCFSAKCSGNVCQLPTSLDGVKNGNETDVDCGSGPIAQNEFYGPTTDTDADACSDTKACLAGSDCTSLVCTGQVCQIPTYTDGVKNGSETDVDCGGAPGARGAGTGPQANRCVADQVCVLDEDCKSDACVGGTCQLARSCAGIHHGGDTCGTGDETWPASATEPEMYRHFKKHESCCTSVVVERPVANGGNYRLDKYSITAGRMRRFIETLANGPNLDGANVSAWVQAARALVVAPAQIAVQYDAFWPTGWNTPTGANTCGSAGNQQCNYGWTAQLGGYRYNNEPGGVGGYGCQITPGGYGSRTFYFPDATVGTPSKYRAFNGESQHVLTQARLDQKALNCVNYVMLAAFCAWDGGRLDTKAEHAYAYGTSTYPWGTEQPIGFTDETSQMPSGPNLPAPVDATNLSRFLRANWSWNYSNMFVIDRYWWLGGRDGPAPLPEPANGANDQSFAVAPPGRYPLNERNGIRDLAGNQMEITAENPNTFRWSKNGSFEWWTHTPNNVGYDSYQFNTLTKYGRTGGRCARPVDGYPAQKIPKR